MVYNSNTMEDQAVLQTAAQMCAAARTAPKAHGKDTIHTLVLTGEDKELLAQKMEQIGQEIMGDKSSTWYGRDAANVRAAQAVVLIGAEKTYRAVPNCGYCGFVNCALCRDAGGHCSLSYVDLGIAVSSAVSAACIAHIDNRIMFSVGKAAEAIAYVENCLWLGIPLSVSGKNIFFDRGIFHD